jgi:hypothetical protein
LASGLTLCHARARQWPSALDRQGCGYLAAEPSEVSVPSEPPNEPSGPTVSGASGARLEDDWLRGGPVRRWVPKPYQDKPIYVFETWWTTGVPKSRVVIEDHWIDYELFNDTLPEKYFPRGANWLMLGPGGPRRLRLAVEHLAQYRGGICFCIDLGLWWVIKLIKRGWMEHLEAYKQHCIDQVVTILKAGHDIRCMFATPKLLEALALELEK